MGGKDKVETFPSNNPWLRNSILHSDMLNFVYPFATSTNGYSDPTSGKWIQTKHTREMTHEEYLKERNDLLIKYKAEYGKSPLYMDRKISPCYDFNDDFGYKKKFACQTTMLWHLWTDLTFMAPL